MNFSSHKNNIIKLIDIALKKEKKYLVNDFEVTLVKTNSLLKNNKLSFWQEQLITITIDELPITIYGLNKVINYYLPYLANQKKKYFTHSIDDICLNLFTYSKYDDLCLWQSDYHYYFDESSKSIFKESELGYREPNLKIVDISKIRVAKISELKIDCNELL